MKSARGGGEGWRYTDVDERGFFAPETVFDNGTLCNKTVRDLYAMFSCSVTVQTKLLELELDYT